MDGLVQGVLLVIAGHQRDLIAQSAERLDVGCACRRACQRNVQSVRRRVNSSISRASGSYPECWGCDSLLAHQFCRIGKHPVLVQESVSETEPRRFDSFLASQLDKIGESSKGRTTGFDPVNESSILSSPATP